jgi:hypothetical protein
MTLSEALDADNFGPAYETAVQEAAARLAEALEALRAHAPRSSYAVPLPAVTPTERENDLTWS